MLRKTNMVDGIGIDEVLHSDFSVPDACTATWADLRSALAGTAGPPRLSGLGNLLGGSNNALELFDARPDATATLAAGWSLLAAPFKGGTMIPQPQILITLSTGPLGQIELPFVFPTGVPAGVPLYFQYWIQDPAAPAGFAASNGLRGTTP